MFEGNDRNIGISGAKLSFMTDNNMFTQKHYREILLSSIIWFPVKTLNF